MDLSQVHSTQLYGFSLASVLECCSDQLEDMFFVNCFILRPVLALYYDGFFAHCRDKVAPHVLEPFYCANIVDVVSLLLIFVANGTLIFSSDLPIREIGLSPPFQCEVTSFGRAET